MVIVAIAGGIGGAINGLMHVTMDAYVFHNIFSVVMMTYSPFIPFLIGCGASLAAGLLLTYFWGITKEDMADFEGEEPEKKGNGLKKDTAVVTSVDIGITELELGSPANGTAVELSNVEDEVFASGAVGLGAAVIPEDGKIYAPADGEILMVFPTKHAIGMQCGDAELLIHVGLNTVELNGEHYTVHTEEGAKVKKGDLLLEFDAEAIRKAGYMLTTPVLVTNPDNWKVRFAREQGEKIRAGEVLVEVKR